MLQQLTEDQDNVHSNGYFLHIRMNTLLQSMEPLRGCPQGEFSGRALCTQEAAYRWGPLLCYDIWLPTNRRLSQSLATTTLLWLRGDILLPLPSLAPTKLRLCHRGNCWRYTRGPGKVKGLPCRQRRVRHAERLAAAAAQSTTGLGDWFFTESGQKDWVSHKSTCDTPHYSSSHVLHCSRRLLIQAYG